MQVSMVMDEHPAFESKVLDPDVHLRLVQDIDHWAAVAQIPPHMIWTPLHVNCTENEIKWVTQIEHHREKGRGGLIYEGAWDKIGQRMQAIAGACVRNFIDARVMTAQQVLEAIGRDETPEASVLLVPNFYVKAKKPHLSAWEAGRLYSLLLERHAQSKLTVAYVQSMQDLTNEFGEKVAQHLGEHYTIFAAA